MRFIALSSSFFVIAVAVAACGDASNQPCTLLQVGATCNLDSDCCTSYCQVEGTGAYCQAKPKVLPACADVDEFCTQDRNCCSGLCENQQCFGGGPGTSCLEIGSTCIA